MPSASRIPLHAQLAETLRAQIASGAFAPGDQLPTEKELMERYGLSSSTVRHAVLALVRDGLVYRKAGRGTFVGPPKIERDLLTFMGFSEEARSKGFEPGTRLLDTRWAAPPAHVGTALILSPDERVFTIERVRTIDGAVVAVENVHFPPSFGERIEHVHLAHASLTTVLEDELGVRLARAYQVVRAVAASPALAGLLEVAVGAPLLQIERVAQLTDGQPCYFSDSSYRADRYDYRGWIERPRNEGAALAGLLTGEAAR